MRISCHSFLVSSLADQVGAYTQMRATGSSVVMRRGARSLTFQLLIDSCAK